MRHVAELRHTGDAKPGCGSKLVARTWRGTEIVEMLTTTCSNSGCAKSISRQEMLDYIEASGGREYPFHADGQIIRVATVEDLNKWSHVKAATRDRVADVKRIVAASGLPMRVVDVEPILGQELLTIYFMSDSRVDFRELVRQLAAEFHTRIEMRQVGARDEARLVADYERCGQHCCCKSFLKVLKPISMRSAKMQKATLDPLKISGRCGRLMCCLRYEDQTYEDLKRRLPKHKARVGTAEGPGTVVDSKILVQLVLVRLDADGREIAVPVEELCDPDACPTGTERREPDALRGLPSEALERRVDDGRRQEQGLGTTEERQRSFRERGPEASDDRSAGAARGDDIAADEAGGAQAPDRHRKRRRRRRRGRDGSDEPQSSSTPPERASPGDAEPGESAGEPDASRRRRRRRRRRGGGGQGASPE